MKKIDLRKLFPEYKLDCFIEVPDEDAEAFAASMTKETAAIYFQSERDEATHNRKMYRYRAHYSLDRGDGIENDNEYSVPSPEEIFEDELMREQLYAALKKLSDKQATRIHAHFYLGMSKVNIAKADGVNEKAVRVAIERGLHNLKISLDG